MITNGVVVFLLATACYGYPQIQYGPMPFPSLPGFQFPVGFGQPGFPIATNFASRFNDGGLGGGSYNYNSVSSSSGPFGGGTTITSSDPGTGVIHTRFSDDSGAVNQGFGGGVSTFQSSSSGPHVTGFVNPGVGTGVSTYHSSSSGPGGVITSRFNDASGSGTGGYVSSSSSNGGFGNNFVNPGVGTGVSTYHSSSSGPGGVITSRFNDASGTGGFVSSSSSSSNGGFGSTYVNPGVGGGVITSRFNDDGGAGGSTSSFVSSSSSGSPGQSQTVTSVTNNGKTTTYVSGKK